MNERGPVLLHQIKPLFTHKLYLRYGVNCQSGVKMNSKSE